MFYVDGGGRQSVMDRDIIHRESSVALLRCLLFSVQEVSGIARQSSSDMVSYHLGNDAK